MKDLFLLFFFPAVLFSGKTYAQHTGSANIHIVLKQLGFSAEECATNLVREKIYPHAPEFSVMVVPIITDEDDYTRYMDGYILVVETATGKIRQRLPESISWISDAMILYDITIDTAPYMLNATTRAFGVRMSYSNRGGPSPLTEKDISLFVPSGDNLLLVLKEYPVYLDHADWDMMCSGDFTEENTVLIIGESMNNGFRDIIAKKTIVKTVKTGTAEDCDSRESREIKKTTLRYVNGRYE